MAHLARSVRGSSGLVALTLAAAALLVASARPFARHRETPATTNRAAAAPSSASVPFGFRLVADEALLATSVVLTPSDTNAVEDLAAPDPTFDVRIDPDPKRTMLLLLGNQSFSWHQIPSGVPMQVTVGMRLSITSSALPAPGVLQNFSLFARGEADSPGYPSLIDSLHSQPWEVRQSINAGFLKIMLSFRYPTMSDATLQALAEQVIASDVEIKLTPLATVRSVSDVTFGRIRLLQIWAY